MDTSTNSKSTTRGMSAVSVMGRRAKAIVLGAVVALLVAVPSVTLADWDIAQKPLFWEAGVRPNVALMIDDSGSMTALVTNESYKHALDAGTITSQAPWYFCTGYDPTNRRCEGSKTAMGAFNARVWAPPTLSTTANSVTIGKAVYNSISSTNNCSNSSNGWARTGNSGNYTMFCKAGHGLPNGAVLNYISGIAASGSATASTSGLSTTQDYYVVNSQTNGYQLSTTFNGTALTAAEMGTLTIGTASGNFLFKGVKITASLPNYVSKSAALCDVSQPPTSPTFFVGAMEGGQTWLSVKRTTMPTADQIGVIVSKSNANPSPAGHNDSCVRWQMATTQSSATSSIPAGRDGAATEYDVDGYAEHLLNKLSASTPSSLNFDDENVYPSTDDNTDVFTAATDDKVIPNLNRIEAARESARQIVLDNSDKMNIGLFSFKSYNSSYYGEMNQSCGTEATSAANKTALIGSAINTPMAAADGAIGALVAQNNTPLARTLYEITQYFQGSSSSLGGASYTSPILYRCQKNYVVMLTDGDPTEDSMSVAANSNAIDSAVTTNNLMNWDGMTEAVDSGGSWGSGCSNSSTCSWLDDVAQFAYDGDFKSGGNDAGGVSFDDTSNSNQWKQQGITTYTIGLGLENDILKRTPLTNTVTITASNVGSSIITSTAHGLVTGDYLLVTNNGGSTLTAAASDGNLNGRYYVVRVDADHFKLATSRANALAGTSVTFTNPGSDIKLSTGPGKSFFVFTPQQLSNSLKAVFSSIENLTAAASAVATNSKGSRGDSLIYQAKFNTEDWSGELSAYKFSSGVVSAVPEWQSNTKLTDQSNKAAIYTVNDSSGAGVAFDYNSVSATQQTAMTNGAGNSSSTTPVANVGDKVVDWFKGNTIAGFRSHSAKGLLGDVINADPLYVQAFNYGYDKLLDYSSSTPTAAGTGADTYVAYAATHRRTFNTNGSVKVSGRIPMLYAGSNDGMMHAFKADTGDEVWSFIPAGVYVGKRDLNNDGDFADTVNGDLETENKLFNLTQTTYSGDKHRFFVDGSASAGDLYTGSTGGWRTYLVGALGGGGRSVYVLDVTYPGSFGAGDVKYEFTHADLGFTYGNPIIAHFADNNWYAVFPNGPDSTNDKAGVWLLNLKSGAGTFLDTTSIDSRTSPNGMMSVAVKVNAEHTVTAIYAGDLKGQVWKYDVFNEGSATSKMRTGTGKLLFTAGTGQSITGGLRLGKLPAITGASTLKGTLVFFGTGKYFETIDKDFTGTSVPQTDSLYSVLDEDTGDNAVVQQSLTNLSSKTLTTSGNYRYAATANTSNVDYIGGKRGWYMDLLNNGAKEGERTVTTPVLFSDRIIFTTLIPSAGDRCLSSGSGWLLEFDPLNGTMLPSPPIDTNGDGVVDSGDTNVAGAKQTGIITEPAVYTGTKSGFKVIGSTNKQKSIAVVGESNPASSGDGSGKGRTSWKQLQ